MSRSRTDALLLWSLRVTACVAGAIVLFVAAFVGREALPALSRLGVGRFVFDPSWYPSEGMFNFLPMLAGTLLVTLGALLVATPIGVASAVFGRVWAPRVGVVHRRMIELLAGIPSVVFGFWGLVTIVPLIARLEPPGASLLAGATILALMIVPTVALFADAAIAGVPAEYARGASALGLSRWATLRRVVLLAARPGILSGVFLATARAVGETMAVLMVCGNVVQVPDRVFDPVRTLTANIALEMAYAMGDHRSALFVTGVALLGLVVALVAASEASGPSHA